MLENIGHIDNRLSRFFILISRQNNEIYQISIAEKYVLVISFIIFYHNIKTVLYKVMASVIYSFVGNLICLDYLVILQQNLSAYNNRFGKTKFNDLSGLVIIEFLMNIMSFHGLSK